MAFSIQYDDLIKMNSLYHGKHYNGELFIENNNTLIKAIEKNINNRIDYLISIPEHNNVIKPIERGKIIYSTKDISIPFYKSAYRMPLLPNAHSLYFLYRDHLPYEKKLKYIKQLFSALQYLHHYIVIGDIHSTNLMISNGKAYIIDLDDARKKSVLKIVRSAYYVKPFEFITPSIYTDIAKMYLESLAFILEIEFQNFIKQFGYQCFWHTITSCNLPKEVMEFLLLCKNPNQLKILGENAYHFENFINPTILNNKKELKLKLNQP